MVTVLRMLSAQANLTLYAIREFQILVFHTNESVIHCIQKSVIATSQMSYKSCAD